MSDFKAIAGVSATLRTLLQDRMETRATVTIAPPDVTVSGASGARVNLFLYRITEDAQLKNQEIPGAGYPADYGHPPLSLDLHYLLTAYGSTDENDADAQQILGDAMRVMHDHGMITEKLLQVRDPERPVLDPSLRGQFEKVKIYLDPISLEDLTKVWTALTKPYRLSAAYSVGVVQIKSQQQTVMPRLVGEPPLQGPRVHVFSLQTPQIAELRLRRMEDPPEIERRIPYGRMGDTLIILGQHLFGDNARVILGTTDASAGVAKKSDNRIEVTIPQDERLQPGPHTVSVAFDVMMGEPPEKHLGFQSNQAVFMLVPGINSLEPDLNASPRTLKITGSGLFIPDLECMTMIGNRVIGSESYTLEEHGQISFELPNDLSPGDHSVRVRVNGAENIEDIILAIPPVP